jgi:hypothetical protein
VAGHGPRQRLPEEHLFPAPALRHAASHGVHLNRKTSSSASPTTSVYRGEPASSQAQRDAAKLYGFDDTHTGVLRDPQVSLLVNQLLAERFR